ncbi:UNVERIFIED_CONTAM: hypothetical protein PYX00_000016 [Menopon gallinae]|uniref:Reverse transcriptase domain-containing protein n=1 Tax=Menopon gallinae TaxID=328185 RepID=A0AAW2I7H3_9NEOP
MNKTGKDYSKPNGYRPISLVPVLGKVISENQFGYISDRSTESSVTKALERAEFYKKKDGCVTISFDAQNAFNNIEWTSILETLEKHAPARLHKIICSFPDKRLAIVQCIDGELRNGVPQGLVFVQSYGVLLFDSIAKYTLKI